MYIIDNVTFEIFNYEENWIWNPLNLPKKNLKKKKKFEKNKKLK
jgi:hypothetical protein